MAVINPPGIPIERGKIHEFANSIECEEPLYHDEVAAQAAGFPSVVMPPTYSTAENFFPKAGQKNKVELLGLDLRFVLHGAQEWTIERPIFAGEHLTVEHEEPVGYKKEGKRGGAMQFYDMGINYKDKDGNIVMRVKSTIIQTGGVVK